MDEMSNITLELIAFGRSGVTLSCYTAILNLKSTLMKPLQK